MATSRSRHRAQRPSTIAAAAGRKRRPASGRASAVGVAGVAGIAAAGAAVIGLTPTLSASPQLAAQLYYLRGTNIGNEPSDEQFNTFVSTVNAGTGTSSPDTPYHKVDYNAGFWPVSKGGRDDLKWDASVQQGLTNLGNEPLQSSDVIFGFSQGAVVASGYKNEHPNAGYTYVLVENPNRPNGGVLERFHGLKIPFLDVTFNGATPDNGDLTIDVARQYDGWADFPTYPLNALATANAILGIAYLHGKAQTEVTAADISQIDTSHNSIYYQYDPDTNTEYYLIPTKELPLLMPFNGIVPDPILKALDPPLRFLVELGYDRSDYGQPTPAKLIPAIDPADIADDLTDARSQTVGGKLPMAGTAAPNTTAVRIDDGETAPHVLPALDASSKQQEQQHVSLTDVTPRKPTGSPSADVSFSSGGSVRSVASGVKALTPRHARPDKPETPRHATAGLGDPARSIASGVKALTPRHAHPNKPETPSRAADKTSIDRY